MYNKTQQESTSDFPTMLQEFERGVFATARDGAKNAQAKVTPTSNKGGNGRELILKEFHEYKIDWLSFTLPMIDKDFTKSSVLVDIGKRVRTEREAANLSLKDLADKLAFSYFFLRKIEDGETQPSIMALSMIARVLNKPYAYFIPSDWLKGLHTSVLERLGDYVSITDQRLPNLKGYNNTFQLFPAGRASWHSEHLQNKFLVQFVGQDLDTLREFGLDIWEMIRWFVSIGATCTRLDLAIDTYNMGSVDDFIAQWYNRLSYLQNYDRYERQDISLTERSLITPALSSQIFTQSSVNGTSQTFYLGSKHSERRLRVYDKFSEMRSKAERCDTENGEIPPMIPDGVFSWVRVELVLRKEYAHNAVCALFLADDMQSFISKIVTDYCDAPAVDWFQSALHNVADIIVESVTRKLRNTELWLLTQVLPSVKRLAQMGSQAVITLADTALEEFFSSPYVHVEAGAIPGLIKGKTYFVDLAGA